MNGTLQFQNFFTIPVIMSLNMAARLQPPLSYSSSLFTSTTQLPLPTNLPFSSNKRLQKHLKIHALGEGDGELKPKGKKKFITRDQEPDQYWQTAGEREGENPMKTPLPYIIIFGMSTPFVILAIAFANGWIKVPVR